MNLATLITLLIISICLSAADLVMGLSGLTDFILHLALGATAGFFYYNGNRITPNVKE